MKYPEIRIEYSWLLAQEVSKPLNEHWGDGSPLLSDDEYKKIAASYRKAWQPYEKRILKGLYDLLGLHFRQNVIDVYIAPWMNAYSDPMVIGVMFKPDRFVEILTHELIHRFLDENNVVSRDERLMDEWKKMFGKHSFNVIVHIPVHALMQAIFDDVLHEPQRTTHDKKLCEQWEPYHNAWKYVEKVGYKEVIEKLRESYRRLGES